MRIWQRSSSIIAEIWLELTNNGFTFTKVSENLTDKGKSLRPETFVILFDFFTQFIAATM